MTYISKVFIAFLFNNTYINKVLTEIKSGHDLHFVEMFNLDLNLLLFEELKVASIHKCISCSFPIVDKGWGSHCHPQVTIESKPHSSKSTI